MAARNIYAQWGIFKVSVDGSNFTEVTNTQRVDEHNPVWSPNGIKILFERFDGGPNKKGLFIINSNGSGLQMLLDTEYNEENPHWR
jgi:Tol biopolymer transport system component